MSNQVPRDAGRSSELHDATWRIVYGALALAVAVLFGFTVRSVLSPFIIYLVLMALLRPYAGTRGYLTIVIVATALIGIWLLEALGGLLSPFLLALAIAYILDPAVDLLERRKLPRAAAIAILGVPALALLATLLIVGIPAIANQIEGLIDQTPLALQRLGDRLEGVRDWLGRLRIPLLPDFDPLRDIDFLNPERLSQMIRERQSRILEGGLAALLGVGRGMVAAFAILGYVVLTPVLLVYVLRDFDRIKERVAALIPPARRERALGLLREYDRLLSRFLRGQLIEATLVGVLTWLGLFVLGFPSAALVGVTAGVFNLVPYLGLIASIIPVVIISLVSASVLGSLFKAAIVFAVVQFIDGSVTGPRIVGESVGLHPVWVMLALALGGFLFGFVGLLLAMPAAVLVKLLIGEGMERYRASGIFKGEPDGAEA